MCEIGKKFANLTYYNDCMKKSMQDKLFFIDHLPKNQDFVFVDFGCADGTMINFLTELYNGEEQDNVYIGYDISEQMIELAKTNYHGPMNFDVDFTNDWENVITKLDSLGKIKYKKVLILSSVIHEVYSYANSSVDIELFWNHVLNSDFDYIVIRDMCPSKRIIDVEIDIDMHDKLIYNYNLGEEYKNQLDEFEKKWGPVWYKQNAYHFLLKYRWKINWAREVNENYFPRYFEDLLQIFSNSKKYTIDYVERFRVPFLDKCFKNDFDIVLDDFTHVKLVFSKNN